MLQRYVHGPGAGDDPLIRYPGSYADKANAHFLYADRLGSIVMESLRDGTITAINTYDDYGVPGTETATANIGRFRYTGQMWLDDLGLYYYKARMYSPTLGRFMQSDPIGYADGMNWYAYVGNDPVNAVDPLGLCDGRLTPEGYIWVCASGSGGGSGGGIGSGGKYFGAAQGGGPDLGPPVKPKPKRPEGKKPQSGQCASPSTSSAEAAAAQAGNRDAYWSSRAAKGDPLAATALGIVRSNTALGVAANTRLISAIVSRNGANPGRAAINREVHQVGVALMREHMRAVNSFGSPTAEQVAQYHFDVFEDFGLPASTFGCAPLTGSQTEAGLTSGIWMGGC